MVVHSALVGVSNALIALLDTAVAGGDTDEKLRKIRAQHDALAKDLGVDPRCWTSASAALEQMIAGAKLVGEVSPRVHARVLANGELAATELGAAYLRSTGARRERGSTSASTSSGRRSASKPSALAICRRAAISRRTRRCRSASRRSTASCCRKASSRATRRARPCCSAAAAPTPSGAYLAGKLEARRLEIWTDAPGFFSADPKAVPSARLIKKLHYREAQEIASAGGGILHPRSISPVRASGIPLYPEVHAASRSGRAA